MEKTDTGASDPGFWQPQKSLAPLSRVLETWNNEEALVVQSQGRHRAARRWGLSVLEEMAGQPVCAGGGGAAVGPVGGEGLMVVAVGTAV